MSDMPYIDLAGMAEGQVDDISAIGVCGAGLA